MVGKSDGRDLGGIAEQPRAEKDHQFIDELLGDHRAVGDGAAFEKHVGGVVVIGQMLEEGAEFEGLMFIIGAAVWEGEEFDAGVEALLVFAGAIEEAVFRDGEGERSVVDGLDEFGF